MENKQKLLFAFIIGFLSLVLILLLTGIFILADGSEPIEVANHHIEYDGDGNELNEMCEYMYINGEFYHIGPIGVIPYNDPSRKDIHCSAAIHDPMYMEGRDISSVD